MTARTEEDGGEGGGEGVDGFCVASCCCVTGSGNWDFSQASNDDAPLTTEKTTTTTKKKKKNK